MYGVLDFLFGLIIGCYLPSFQAQVLHIPKLSQENCHTNCEHGLINDLDYCQTFFTVQFSDTIPDSTLVYFEVIGEASQNLFSLDIPSECTGYKQNAKYYCTQVDNNYFNITVIVYAQPKFSKAQFRCYLTTPNGKRIESGILTFPEIQDARNATAKLQINGVNISTTEDCSTTIDKNNLNLEIDCSSVATPCFIEIQLNDSVVYKRIGNHGVYSKSMESKEVLFINISYAACSLERNFKSTICRIKQDSKDYLKEISNSNNTMIATIVSCSIVFALLLASVIVYIIYRKKVNTIFKQKVCRNRRQKEGRENIYQNADTSEIKWDENTTIDVERDKSIEATPFMNINAEKWEQIALTESEKDTPDIKRKKRIRTEHTNDIPAFSGKKYETAEDKKEIYRRKNARAEDEHGRLTPANLPVETPPCSLVAVNINISKDKRKGVYTGEDLILALEQNDFEQAKRLINSGVDVNKAAENNITPLMIACKNRRESICELLIKKGALLDAQATSHKTALMIACKNGSETIAKMLVDNSASLEKQNHSGNTALMIACKNDHYNIAEMLIESKASVNSTNSFGMTPLMFACKEKHTNGVKLLLKNGANINLKRNDGMTALQIAERKQDDETVKLLSEHMNKKKVMAKLK